MTIDRVTEPLVAGIDAGGTKTRAFAATRSGEIVGRGAGGGANLLSSPDPHGSIGAALREALGGRTPDAVVLSASGGDRPADRERGREILAALLPPTTRIAVTHDAEAALYAGNPQGCGIVLIAGTGSIAYGRNEDGDVTRAGGWGHLIGDEGSAVWLGLEALRAAAHAADGRGAPTRIVEHLYRELGITAFADVLASLYGRPHPPPAIAAATRALALAAAGSDAIAVRIVERGAHDLARAATVVAMSLALDGPVYLAGGAFESLSLLEPAVRREILGMIPRAAVERIGAEPALGAARLAMKLAWGPG